MTFVVKRPGGRWEIRESVATPAGPRARSLATFRTLDLEVLEHAETAAKTTFDRSQVLAAARRAGAPVEEAPADAAARALLAELAAGNSPSPGLARLVCDRLTSIAMPELAAGDSIAEWAGKSAVQRGNALRDLLELTDRLPSKRRGPLRYPGLRPTRASG